MTANASGTNTARGASWRGVLIRSDTEAFRALVITAGLCWSVLFVVIGLRYELQMYADGSLFSYSIAVQDAWAFHWRDMPGRLLIYLLFYLPAEAYVELTGDAYGGIVVYGFLFFVMPLVGLLATLAVDRSKGRIIFSYACLSTAFLCPLVFGFPTEMWAAHALFWPTLAVCHYVRGGIGAIAIVFAMLLALVFTHEAALIFVAIILATLLLRGMRDPAFLRVLGACSVIVPIWIGVKEMLPPDAYIANVLVRAALHVFDITILTGHLILLLFGTLAMYAIIVLVLRRPSRAMAPVYAACVVAVVLAGYWLWFDNSLHTDNRYYLRTALIVATPIFGALAAAHALAAEGRVVLPVLFRPHLMVALTSGFTARVAAGALALVMVVHAVETAKFVTGWTQYKAAVRALAMGTASDPTLGDSHFVSSRRIGAGLNRLSWFSTTQYLSVLVAARFAPARLVVDPTENFFWLSCQTATANLESDRVVPAESRRLVQRESCLHR